jgi:HAD superfamily phosphatase (TIGR01668 family)
MIKKLIPNLRLDSVLEITPELLSKRKISLLMLDLDNTLSPYRGGEPSAELQKWKDSLIKAGVRLVIVSNTKKQKAKNFAEKLSIPYIDHARKPFTAKTRKVMKSFGASPSEAALAGDQIFTDVLCANSAGIMSILVTPLELTNVLYILRYAFETIFRIFAPKTL